MCSNYDILCFSESKLDQYDVIELKHFKSLPPLNRINVKQKSEGIVVFVRDYIYENVTVLQNTNEKVLWFIVNNNVFDYDILFSAVYIPPENSVYIPPENSVYIPPESSVYIPPENSVYSDIDMFDVIQNDIVKYTAETRCKVCLLGNFNAHTGLKTDFTDINDYVLNSVQLYDVINIVNLDTLGIDVTRHNLDLLVNNYGNQLLQMCQSLELLIANGRLGKDQGVGALTC